MLNIRHNASLTKLNSWHVGGRAERLFVPNNIEQLVTFLQSESTHGELTWLGLGSNVLIRDGGIAGTVIMTQPGLTHIEQVANGKLRIEAGVACPKVAKVAAKHGLTGAEFLAGIPGTIGGALEMNAGAFGGEIWQIVSAVEMISANGQRYQKSADDFEIAYRNVSGRAKNEWFVAAYLDLAEDTQANSKATIQKLLQQRKLSQPIGQFSCGSVFKNPKPHYAAELIEGCGLKGLQFGDAEISSKHANFIINRGGASAFQVETLIKKVQWHVLQKHQISLIPEVRILGENAYVTGEEVAAC